MSSPHTTSETLTAEHRARLEQIQQKFEEMLDTGKGDAFGWLEQELAALGEDPALQALRAAVLVLRAEALVDLEENEAALEDAEQALSLGVAAEEKAAAHCVAGWAYFNLEDYERAREKFAEALALMPDEVMYLHGHALTLLELGEYEQARSELTHAIYLDDEDASLYALRSEIQIHLEDIESAERDIRNACELDEDEPDYALSLARLLLITQRVDEALALMNDVIGDGHEASLEALLFRSHVRLLAGQNKEASEDAMRASNRFPDEAFAFVQLANVQLAQGKTAMAMRAAERAVGLDASLPDAYLARGTALHLSGKSEEARKDLERASAAPAELPMLLLGSAFELTGGAGLDNTILEMLKQQEKPAGGGAGGGGFEDAFAALGGLGGMPGMGNLDPMAMLSQMFDESGNIRGPLKPLFEMALKNAPKIMQNMPESMKANLGGIDPEKLDLSNVSTDQIEEQMREFYRTMKKSKTPKEPGSDEE